MNTTHAAAALAPATSRARQAQEALVTLNPDELVSKVENAGLAWADADEEASLLEETRKTLLAQLTMEHMRSQGPKPLPMGQSEALAMADARYKTHVEGMVKARSQSNRHRVRYDSGKAQLDLQRTLIATRRAEMQLAGSRT